MCTKRTLLGASKNRAWSLRLEKVDFAVIPSLVLSASALALQLGSFS